MNFSWLVRVGVLCSAVFGGYVFAEKKTPAEDGAWDVTCQCVVLSPNCPSKQIGEEGLDSLHVWFQEVFVKKGIAVDLNAACYRKRSVDGMGEGRCCVGTPTDSGVSRLFRGTHVTVIDGVVLKWAVAALRAPISGGDSALAKHLETRRTASELNEAWVQLKQCRDSGLSLDLNLASAEHYMFIRAFAATRGDEDIEALPALYGGVKAALGPASKLLQLTDKPMSPVDDSVIRWGERGVSIGLKDYEAITGQKPSPTSGNANKFKLAIEGFYDNYKNTVKKASCSLSIG